MTMDFLKGVLEGKKKLFKMDQIKIMNHIPRYPEICTEHIWLAAKNNGLIQQYFPDSVLKSKKPPNRTFLFTVS